MTEVKKYWDAIVNLMNDDIREEVHDSLVPCTEVEFLKEYIKRDPAFSDLLYSEFSIDVYDLH